MLDVQLAVVRPALYRATLPLLFNIESGFSFAVFEVSDKGWIRQEITAHPKLHDAKSETGIWRYLQRAHFHTGRIGGYTVAMILLASRSGLRPGLV